MRALCKQTARTDVGRDTGRQPLATSFLVELERERNLIFLWIGILGGVLIFFIALVLKRIKHGPDLLPALPFSREEV